MAIYADWIFPHVLDFVMSRRNMMEHRAEVLQDAYGEVLEVGFGTALNLPYYPEAVSRLTVLDPADVLRKRVSKRIAAARMPIEKVHLDAAKLPFDEARFDCIVSTWTLCSIAHVSAALGEMYRVLKPGGRLLFIEHGRSDDPGVARWQDRLNPVQQVIGCGCNLNRPIDRLIDQAGFEFSKLERWEEPKTPRIIAPHYRGIATRN